MPALCWKLYLLHHSGSPQQAFLKRVALSPCAPWQLCGMIPSTTERGARPAPESGRRAVAQQYWPVTTPLAAVSGFGRQAAMDFRGALHGEGRLDANLRIWKHFLSLSTALLRTDGISESFEVVKANTSENFKKRKEKNQVGTVFFPLLLFLSASLSHFAFLLSTIPLSLSFCFSPETLQPAHKRK